MSWKLRLVLLLGILASVNSSESTLKGEVYVHSSSNTRIIAQFTPLSQQPKVANIKNSLFEFLLLTDSQSCGELNKKDFTDDLPVIVVIDFTQVKQPACGMTNKIANIKNAGGYGLFIVTDQTAFSLNHCRMYDSNSFLTAVMDRNNYLKLTMNQLNSIVLGQITISLKDSKLKLLQIWTSSLNAATYDNVILLGKIFHRLPTLKEEVVWTPRIATLGCTHGDNPNICTTAEFVASCGCKGEFCSPQTHEKTPEILIKEDIRQLKIFTQYPSKYFAYIQIFKKQCFQGYSKQKYSEECATYVMNKLGIDSQSINKVISDFVNKCAVEEQAKLISSSELYTTLEKDKRAFVNYGRYPLLLLNKQILQYKNQDDLAGQLCRKLQLQDQGCFQVKSTTVVTTTSTGVLFYVLLIILLVAIGAGVVYFYRKKLKKDMNKQIKMQVSTAVEHYFALTDVK